jgi:tripartite-type tricarboxylate transporter receptor subunit TctC
MVGSFNTINATLYDKLNFNFIGDIAPVARINRVALVMEVNPSVPAKTGTEFTAYAKANPELILFETRENDSGRRRPSRIRHYVGRRMHAWECVV